MTIGIVFAWVLGLGVLFLALFSGGSGGGNGLLGARALFGSIFGLSAADAQIAAVVGACIVATVLAVARPLLFASVDPGVAAARGVPVRALGLVFLLLLGATAGEATQAVGALLLLGLLAAPAGAAHRLTASPYLALGAVSGVRGDRDVARPRAQLRGSRYAAEHGRDRGCERDLSARVPVHGRRLGRELD